MSIKITGSLYPKDSKTVQLKNFEVPYYASEIRVDFDYIPKSIENMENQITLSFYDSMGNFMGRYDKYQNFIIGNNGSHAAFNGLPLPGMWKVEIESQSLVSRVDYTLEVDFKGNQKYKWYKGEFHAHSTHSDGKFSVKELSDYIKSNNFDFFFLTDHNNITGYRDLLSLKDQNGFLGEELTTFKGHMLILGNNNFVDWKDDKGYEKSISLIKKESDYLHSLIGVAHPFTLSEPICGGCGWKYEEDPFDDTLFDFVEIWNGNMEAKLLNMEAVYSWIKAVRSGKRITATSGFDIHGPTDPTPSFWLKNHLYLRKIELLEILYAIKHGMTYICVDPINLNLYDNIPGQVVKYLNKVKFKFEISNSPEGKTLIFTKNETLDLGETYADEVYLENLEADDFAIILFFDKEGTPLVITNPVYLRKGEGS